MRWVLIAGLIMLPLNRRVRFARLFHNDNRKGNQRYPSPFAERQRNRVENFLERREVDHQKLEGNDQRCRVNQKAVGEHLRPEDRFRFRSDIPGVKPLEYGKRSQGDGLY